MMWITLTLICAFLQALWMALSKRELQTLSPLRFMLFMRLPILAALLPALWWCDFSELSTELWGAVLLAAVLECVRVVAFARGTRHDYYSTYSLLNTSPLFVLLVAPFVVGEGLTWLVACGALAVVVGGLVFYRAGRLQLSGLVAAASAGVGTTFTKLGLSLSSPLLFTVLLFGTSTIMLLAVDGVRSGFGDTARHYRSTARRTLPISGLNLVSIVTFMFALDLVPVTHFMILFRMNLIFGFILSLILLKEHDRWPIKLLGAAFILAGSMLIALKGGG